MDACCAPKVRGQAKALSIPPGSTPATVKLKGIDGGLHKRRNMWFNSMIREEPYPGLTRRTDCRDAKTLLGRLWRCCMVVVSSLRGVGLRHNERNPSLVAIRWCWALWGHCRRKVWGRWGWRQISTALRPGLHVLQWRVQRGTATSVQSIKRVPVRTGVCNPTPRSWFASNRASAMARWIRSRPCTHRPSSHESRGAWSPWPQGSA